MYTNDDDGIDHCAHNDAMTATWQERECATRSYPALTGIQTFNPTREGGGRAAAPSHGAEVACAMARTLWRWAAGVPAATQLMRKWQSAVIAGQLAVSAAGAHDKLKQGRRAMLLKQNKGVVTEKPHCCNGKCVWLAQPSKPQSGLEGNRTPRSQKMLCI